MLMTHKAISKKGGQASSHAKTMANRAKATAFWSAVRAGKLPAPRQPRIPPRPADAGRLLSAYCRSHGIARLEVFGSAARGDARRGSDIDLIATFAANPGLAYYSMADDMAEILGVPVHLLSRDAVDGLTNPYRRRSILEEAAVVFDG
jgi:predicted nucleotidyltransferase